jgi:hypothetical protein
MSKGLALIMHEIAICQKEDLRLSGFTSSVQEAQPTGSWTSLQGRHTLSSPASLGLEKFKCSRSQPGVSQLTTEEQKREVLEIVFEGTSKRIPRIEREAMVRAGTCQQSVVKRPIVK